MVLKIAYQMRESDQYRPYCFTISSGTGDTIPHS